MKTEKRRACHYRTKDRRIRHGAALSFADGERPVHRRAERTLKQPKKRNESEPKLLWWTPQKFGAVGSAALRKNRTSETRRWAGSIRDVAFAGRRESVAEAPPRCRPFGGPRLI